MWKIRVGFEHLNPIALHPEGLDSSDLVRGSLRSSSSYPAVIFCGMHTSLSGFHPWSLSPRGRMGVPGFLSPPPLYPDYLLSLLY